VLVALNGERARKGLFQRSHALARPGDIWRVTVLRQDLLRQSEAAWFVLPTSRVQLRVATKLQAAQRQRQNAWLGTVG
ncbi:MAG: M61 family peptidase, partial [Thiomonas sp.]